MTQIVAVSKAGENVLTATDPNDFIFHSTYNTFKIVASGSLTSQTIDADPKTLSVSHGQSSAPAVYAFVEYADGYVATPNERERADTSPVERYWIVEVDNSNVYFIFYKGSSANYSVNIKYYIFEAPI
jgi:hypothetical protein